MPPHPPTASQDATEAALACLSALMDAESRLAAVDAQLAVLDRHREHLAEEVMVHRFRVRFGDSALQVSGRRQ